MVPPPRRVGVSSRDVDTQFAHDNSSDTNIRRVQCGISQLVGESGARDDIVSRRIKSTSRMSTGRERGALDDRRYVCMYVYVEERGVHPRKRVTKRKRTGRIVGAFALARALLAPTRYIRRQNVNLFLVERSGLLTR